MDTYLQMPVLAGLLQFAVVVLILAHECVASKEVENQRRCADESRPDLDEHIRDPKRLVAEQ